MFKAIARGQIKKTLARLVREKGADWCIQAESVKTELIQRHPQHQTDVQALCYIVTTGGYLDLLGSPEPITDQETQASAVLRVTPLGLHPKDAQWAVQCWAEAVSYYPHQQRVEISAQLKLRIEAQHQFALDEKKQQLAALDRVMAKARAKEKWQKEEVRAKKEMARAQVEKAEARAEAQSKRRNHMIMCWCLAFPKEVAAIKNTATLAAEAQGRAEVARIITNNPYWEGQIRGFGRLGSNALSYKYEKLESRDEAAERMMREHIRSVQPSVDAEIWRRIESAPDQNVLQAKLEAAWQVELKRKANRR